MKERTASLTRALATICRKCPICSSARRRPGTRLAGVVKGIAKGCPACIAYAEVMKMDKRAKDNGQEDPFFGRLNDPTAAAAIKGICGDEMEFHLVIRDDRIEDVRYWTDGCDNTRSCGRAVARRAKGRSITDALSISAGELIRSGECEQESGRHCAILAVTTLYRAIADYLLRP